jgi:hypothetical protein
LLQREYFTVRNTTCFTQLNSVNTLNVYHPRCVNKIVTINRTVHAQHFITTLLLSGVSGRFVLLLSNNTYYSLQHGTWNRDNSFSRKMLLQ